MVRGHWWIALGLMVVLVGTPAWGANPDAPPAGSLFEDPIASHVGDIVIVHLNTIAASATIGGQSTTTTNSSIVSVFVQQGLQTTESSTTTWQHALSGDLAMRVTGMTPTGMMQLQGSRHFVLDGSAQTLTITGVIRPQDLGADDSVPGARMADVVATTTGKLNTVQRFGLWDALALLFGVGVLLKLLP